MKIFLRIKRIRAEKISKYLLASTEYLDSHQSSPEIISGFESPLALVSGYASWPMPARDSVQESSLKVEGNGQRM